MPTDPTVPELSAPDDLAAPGDLRVPTVFLGPTMPVDAARGLLAARFVPPARNGDVLRALEHRPAAIVIIDGYFNWVPSVWHKEILFALDCGVAVYGASSMGALRAAELDAYGMIGFGRVYQAFRSGRLTDDDEVAVLHGDADSNYRALSDAMVTVRATIDDAVTDAVLDADGGAAVIAHIKAIFFPDRDLRHFVASDACARILGSSRTAALRAWLPAHRRDVKREDAIGVLSLLARDGIAPMGPPTFDFQSTSNWLRLAAAVTEGGAGEAPRDADGDGRRADTDDTALQRAVGRHDDLLTECRLSGDWPILEAAAIARLELAGGATACGATTEDERDAELAHWCISLGLEDAADIELWLSANSIAWPELVRFVGREVRMSRLRERHRAGLAVAVREVLIATGRYEGFVSRSRRRRAWLAAGDRRPAIETDAASAIDDFRARHGLSAHEPASFLARRHGWDDADDMAEDLALARDFDLRADAATALPSARSTTR